MNIPSWILGAITAFFAGRYVRQDKFILKDRELWRNYLRIWASELSRIRFYNQDKKYILKTYKNNIAVRLNPKRDIYILYLMDLMVDTDDIDEFSRVKERIISSIAYILKKDWERVKNDSSLFGPYPNLNVIIAFILIVVSYSYFVPKLNLTENLSNLYDLVYIISVIALVIFILVSFMVTEYYRNVGKDSLKKNYFEKFIYDDLNSKKNEDCNSKNDILCMPVSKLKEYGVFYSEEELANDITKSKLSITDIIICSFLFTIVLGFFAYLFLQNTI